MQKGLLLVVSGPSGCGKGTVLKEVMQQQDLYYSVSLTTRAPRPGEVDGVQYHFVSKEQFEKMIARDEVLEHAEFCGNYYGTPRDAVEAMRNEGKNVILEIEVQGAQQVMHGRSRALAARSRRRRRHLLREGRRGAPVGNGVAPGGQV